MSQTWGCSLRKFESSPGRPCCNGRRIEREVLAAGSIGFALAGYLKFSLKLFPRRQKFFEIFFDKLKQKVSGFSNAES